MRFPSARADAVRVLAVAAVVVLAGCGHSAKSFPPSPERLVTDDQASTDLMLALGFRPVAAVGMTSTTWAPALAPYLTHAENLGSRTGGSANLDAISGASPDAIVGPVSLKTEGWAGQLERTAPTIYYAPTTSWDRELRAVARAVSAEGRADRVISTLGRRAAAIRGQVAGKTLAVLRVASPQTFSTVNDDEPVAAVAVQSLGLHNVHLKPQQYPYGCAAAPVPPKPCSTNSLYVGIVSTLTAANALLVETDPAGPTAAAAFERNPYFRGLAAVRAGRVAAAPAYEVLGPLGVAFEYTAIERAFGLEELRANVPGVGGVDLTLDRAARRLCWASAKPAAMTIAGAAAVALPAAPAAGRCAIVPAAVARSLGRAPGQIRARTGTASLAIGPPSPIA